eukprot:CAMPEP_0116931306 /NCGR_PEP_ID=MMETSP0467-20121206/27734_1 /TAXON_ID=283647 /ORGANISM="Mesodinium pulex, Strain SPMC105" /LENGTH=104 /DNA_ID=CAMNT_0004611713 /DNA_START=168 /DNA_END=482 /DNA_ORIENTATION=+
MNSSEQLEQIQSKERREKGQDYDESKVKVIENDTGQMLGLKSNKNSPNSISNSDPQLPHSSSAHAHRNRNETNEPSQNLSLKNNAQNKNNKGLLECDMCTCYNN